MKKCGPHHLVVHFRHRSAYIFELGRKTVLADEDTISPHDLIYPQCVPKAAALKLPFNAHKREELGAIQTTLKHPQRIPDVFVHQLICICTYPVD